MSVIGVYQIPSHLEQGWRHDLYRHAVEAGWTAHEGVLSGRRDPGLNHLLVTSDPAQTLSAEVDHWVVLGLPPGETASWVQSVLGLSGDGCVSLTSSIMAAADFLVHAGAQFFRADGDRIDLPLLGRVGRTEVAAPYSFDAMIVGRARKMLGHFESLPTQQNATAEWDSSILRNAGADAFGIGAIDLTGRARGLVEGPFLPLSPGRWRIDSEWSVSDITSEVALQFNWGPYGDTIAHEESVPRSGRYRAILDADWETVAPAMLGVSLMHPCFHGVLDLVSLRLSRLD